MAKSALKASLHELPEPWPALLGFLLPMAAIGTGLLMARFLAVLRDSRGDAEDYGGNPWTVVGWSALVCASVVVIWWWAPGSRFGEASLAGGNVLGALWPVVVAGVIAWKIWRARPRLLALWIGRVPPGDLLALMERAIDSLPRIRPHHYGIVRAIPVRLKRALLLLGFRALEIARLLASWKGAVLALLALVLLLYVLGSS